MSSPESLDSLHGTRHHTPAHVNSIRFHVAVDSGAATLRPVIDGIDLLQGYANSRGLHPERLLPPLSCLLLPTGEGRLVLIGSCGCGETGCGCLTLRLSRLGDEVLWEPVQDAPDETLSRRYRFGLTQYLDAVDEASGNRPGEGRGGRIARRVRLALDVRDQRYGTARTFQDAVVDWIAAWPWDGSTVHVSFSSPAGQEVVDFSPRPDETDDDMGARIAADITERRDR